MPLWKITAKNSWTFSKDQVLTKGMFIEMSTPSKSRNITFTPTINIWIARFPISLSPLLSPPQPWLNRQHIQRKTSAPAIHRC